MLEKRKAALAPLIGGAHDEAASNCQPTQRCNGRLTNLGEPAFNRRTLMATDPLAKVRNEIGLRVAEIREPDRVSRRSISTRGWTRSASLRPSTALRALEGLARRSAQLALLPGHRVAVQTCLEHVDEALDSEPKPIARPSSPRSRFASTDTLARVHALEAQCAPFRSCSTISSTRARATPSSS